MIKVGFWDNSLSERGSTTALFDYAYYNEKILGNKSYIFYHNRDKNNDWRVIQKFKRHFLVRDVRTFDHINGHLYDDEIKHLYIIKFGNNDGKLSREAKNLVHCVFNCRAPHGDVYATLGQWISGNEEGGVQCVPHMVALPEAMPEASGALPEALPSCREEWGIPEEAIVFGSYGGSDSFNIPYVRKVVKEIALEREDVYFVFVNFDPFCGEDVKRVRFLPKIVEGAEKVRFIESCDAMIHAQTLGETFGLAVGEFASKGKPVISCAFSEDRRTNHGHVHILGKNAFWYDSEEEIRKILCGWKKGDGCEVGERGRVAYLEYTPEKVMKIFESVFLQ